ncbi:MAG: heavy metal translocating P-type ATPase [Cytophagaceae bacterium]
MKATYEKLKCYHCDADITSETISYETKIFCCEGCKSVYRILNDASLCQYYNFSDGKGNSLKDYISKEYVFLDNEEIIAGLLDFKNENYAKVTFYIPSVHCSSCIWLLENLNRLHKGIIKSQINFLKKEVSITFNINEISLRKLAELLDAISYPPDINLSQLDKKEKKKDNLIIYKIGVAGFCFGNIMLFSFPEYLGLHKEDGIYLKFFGYLNLLLGMPVVAFSAFEYFKNAWFSIKNRIVNIDIPVALGISVITSRSVYEIVSGTGAGYFDSLTGLIFLLLIGRWYQQKTYQILSFDRNYKSYLPVAVNKKTDQGLKPVSLKDIQIGDFLLIRNEEIIPADGIIVSGEAQVDYSFVTGESLPVIKAEGERLYAGGRQKGKTIEIKVIKPVNDSYFTQLWNQDIFLSERKVSFSKYIDNIGKGFTIAVIFLSLITLAVWWQIDQSRAFFAFTSVLIIFCPCTLALAIPFCFGNAMNKMGQKGFYLKNPDVVEQLARTKTIVFDKTGTLTEPEKGKISFKGRTLSEEEKIRIKSLTSNSTHPLSRKIYSSLSYLPDVCTEKFKEYAGKGIEGQFGQDIFKVGKLSFVYPEAPVHAGKDSESYLSINGQLAGSFIFENSFRENVGTLLQNLRSKYDLFLISGDNDSEKTKLSHWFDATQMAFSMKPIDKLKYIEDLKKNKTNVAMVGDGLNDAGALKIADTGISITDNIYQFSPSCDVILEGNQVKNLDKFLKYCRANLNIMRSSLAISLFYNGIGLSFAMTGNLNPLVAAILMPVSSLSIVLYVIALSNYYAKKTGVVQIQHKGEK